MYENFPYSNFHDLNTDWIVKKIKDVETSEANAKASEEASAESASASAQSANASAQSADASAQSANASAQSANASAQSATEADNYVTSTRNQVNVLQSRVDNIIPSGTQTEGNTELLDIRVAYNGEIYPSAGDAVRGQVSSLQNAIDNTDTQTIQLGTWYDTAVFAPSTTRCCTKLIPVVEGDKIVISNGSYKHICKGYNSSKVLYRGDSTYNTSDETVIIHTTGYFAVIFADIDTSATIDLSAFNGSVVKIPKIWNDIDNLYQLPAEFDSKLSFLRSTFLTDDNAKTNLDTNSLWWNKKAGYLSTQNGWSVSASYDSYWFLMPIDGSIWVDPIDSAYTQLCIYPSGSFGDSNYARYRTPDNNLPTESAPLSVSTGAMVIYTVSAGNTTATMTINKLVKDGKLGRYHVLFSNGVLEIDGKGVRCSFSDEAFDQSHCLFELQDLYYNQSLIFDKNNDYIGPVQISGDPIIGAKHGGEITDSINIICDGIQISDGDNVYCNSINIIVDSHIGTDFSRKSYYAFGEGKLVTTSVITFLTSHVMSAVFGCGIISSEDSNTIAWINDKPIIEADTSGTLKDTTSIITTGGTLISKRLNVTDIGTGIRPVYFQVYAIQNRKKLYYYDLFGTSQTIESGTVLSSTVSLEFC